MARSGNLEVAGIYIRRRGLGRVVAGFADQGPVPAIAAVTLF